MKVERANPAKFGKGVVSVNVFRPLGGAHCTCTISGNVGTSSNRAVTGCSCSSRYVKNGAARSFGQGEGCTVDGTLVAKDGSGGPRGKGFEAKFTANGGIITDISITNPGENYTQAPELMIASGGVSFPHKFQYLADVNPVPIEYAVTTGTTTADRGVVAEESVDPAGSLTEAEDSVILKLTAKITNLDIGEYLETSSNEYLKVTHMTTDGKTISVERDAAPKGLKAKGSREAVAAGSHVQLVQLPYTCRVNFWATLSVNDPLAGPQIAGLSRGQLGTAATPHASDSKVYAVHWAGSEKDSEFSPSRKYNFRVAAYNTAGFSPFVYY